MTATEPPKAFTGPVSLRSAWMMKSLGVVSGPIKELGDTLYQFEHPYVLDSAASEKMLGLRPTPLSDGAAATVAWWKDKELAQAS